MKTHTHTHQVGPAGRNLLQVAHQGHGAQEGWCALVFVGLAGLRGARRPVGKVIHRQGLLSLEVSCEGSK